MTDPGDGVSLLEHITALLRERDRALDVATVEREKAASALREGMTERIAALDKLVMAKIEAKAAEFRAIHAASQAAIVKAEDAMQRRLDLLNEFRSQMADDSQKYAVREVVDAQITDLRHQISEMTDKMGKLV